MPILHGGGDEPRITKNPFPRVTASYARRSQGQGCRIRRGAGACEQQQPGAVRIGILVHILLRISGRLRGSIYDPAQATRVVLPVHKSSFCDAAECRSAELSELIACGVPPLDTLIGHPERNPPHTGPRRPVPHSFRVSIQHEDLIFLRPPPIRRS